MTRVDEFDSFYLATSAQTLQVTYALCGDRHVAQEATADAYRRAWRDWAKIRGRHPLGYVRTEAWKLTALSRGTHPLRRRHEDDGDTLLLSSLAQLSGDDRRLIVLMTLGDIDLEEASLEVGVTAEEGIENATTALAELERLLGQGIDGVERRMHGLADITEGLPMPPAEQVRTAARRGRRRNTILLVAGAVAAILLAGVVVTDTGALADRADMPRREKIGNERPDEILNASKLDASDLLSTTQVSRLDDSAQWKIVGTDTNTKNTTPYATCPTTRFADKNPLRVFVRTYESSASSDERVAQAIEVSRSDSDAEAAYHKIVSWFADCQHPRVQLVSSYTVERPFGNFTILRLRSHRSPERTFTVGFSHSGTVTSTLVHEVDSTTGPSIGQFAQTLNDSVARVCQDSGGTCTNDIIVRASDPPATSTSPAFLGIVDLPPIADIDRVWASANLKKSATNPAATLCDAANFTGSGATQSSSRVFVIPEATVLPAEFGVTETVGHFASASAAKKFVSGLADKVKACPKKNLAASVTQSATTSSGPVSSHEWRLAFEIAKKQKAYYRMALVRRGSDVAQVTFTSTPTYDMSSSEFQSLAQRAGQRLRYLHP